MDERSGRCGKRVLKPPSGVSGAFAPGGTPWMAAAGVEAGRRTGSQSAKVATKSVSAWRAG
jgi:hypothetical protein